MKMKKVSVICLALIAWVALANIRADRQMERDITRQIDSVAIYRQEVADLNVELTKALALQQCYHEELIRVVLEHHPDSIYTIPCNGRKVVTR